MSGPIPMPVIPSINEHDLSRTSESQFTPCAWALHGSFDLLCFWWVLVAIVLRLLSPVPSVATVPVCLAAGLLALTAWRLQRGRPEAVLEGALALQKRAEDKAFGWINAGTYSAVFLLFLILPRFGLQNYIFPGFVALLGLHFFPMPTLYRHTSNIVAGACMIAWAVFCALVFKADGNREAAYVALGAGTILWSSSAWAIVTAKRLFQVARAEAV